MTGKQKMQKMQEITFFGKDLGGEKACGLAFCGKLMADESAADSGMEIGRRRGRSEGSENEAENEDLLEPRSSRSRPAIGGEEGARVTDGVSEMSSDEGMGGGDGVAEVERLEGEVAADVMEGVARLRVSGGDAAVQASLAALWEAVEGEEMSSEARAALGLEGVGLDEAVLARVLGDLLGKVRAERELLEAAIRGDSDPRLALFSDFVRLERAIRAAVRARAAQLSAEHGNVLRALERVLPRGSVCLQARYFARSVSLGAWAAPPAGASKNERKGLEALRMALKGADVSRLDPSVAVLMTATRAKWELRWVRGGWEHTDLPVLGAALKQHGLFFPAARAQQMAGVIERVRVVRNTLMHSGSEGENPREPLLQLAGAVAREALAHAQRHEAKRKEAGGEGEGEGEGGGEGVGAALRRAAEGLHEAIRAVNNAEPLAELQGISRRQLERYPGFLRSLRACVAPRFSEYLAAGGLPQLTFSFLTPLTATPTPLTDATLAVKTQDGRFFRDTPPDLLLASRRACGVRLEPAEFSLADCAHGRVTGRLESTELVNDAGELQEPSLELDLLDSARRALGAPLSVQLRAAWDDVGSFDWVIEGVLRKEACSLRLSHIFSRDEAASEPLKRSVRVDQRDDRTHVERPCADLLADPEVGAKVLLLAGAGAGKSTELRRVFAAWGRMGERGEGAVVEVLLPLARALGNRGRVDMVKAFQHCWGDKMDESLAAVMDARAERAGVVTRVCRALPEFLLRARRTRLLLDGLDEVSAADLELGGRAFDFWRFVREYAPRWVVTSRPSSHVLLRPTTTAHLVLLSADQQREFIDEYARHFPREGGSLTQLREQVGGHEALGDITSVPVLLEAMCFLFNEPAAHGLGDPTTWTITRIYFQLVRYMMLHWRARREQRSLAELAREETDDMRVMHTFLTDLVSRDRHLFHAFQVRLALERAWPDVDFSLRAEQENVLVTAGFLARVQGASDDILGEHSLWSFLHESLREYFHAHNMLGQEDEALREALQEEELNSLTPRFLASLAPARLPVIVEAMVARAVANSGEGLQIPSWGDDNPSIAGVVASIVTDAATRDGGEGAALALSLALDGMGRVPEPRRSVSASASAAAVLEEEEEEEEGGEGRGGEEEGRRILSRYELLEGVVSILSRKERWNVLRMLDTVIDGVEEQAVRLRSLLLREAVSQSNEQELRHQLVHGADPLHSGERGGRALHACAERWPEGLGIVLEHLRQPGDDAYFASALASPDGENRTPLHCAAARHEYDAVEALLDAGSNPNSLDLFGFSPLALVFQHFNNLLSTFIHGYGEVEARRRRERCVEALLDAGAEVTSSVLGAACSGAIPMEGVSAEEMRLRAEACSALLDRIRVDDIAAVVRGAVLGCNTRHGLVFRVLTLAGADPCQVMMDDGTPALARLIDDRLADPDSCREAFSLAGPEVLNLSFTTHSVTLLHLAVFRARWTLIPALLDAGANPLARSTYELTPLHYMLSQIEETALDDTEWEELRDQARAVEALLTHGGEGDQRLFLPTQVLVGAVAADSAYLLERCLADTTASVTWQGSSLTELATENNATATLAFLLDHISETEGGEGGGEAGGGESAAPSSPLSLLRIAARAGSLGAMELLLERGVEVDGEEDEEKITALDVAVASGQMEAAQFLWERGARGSRRPEALTPLHYAAQYDQAQMVRWLLEQGMESEPRGELGLTPFLMAAWNGSCDAVRPLLPRFDIPPATSTAGHTAVHLLSGNERGTRMLKILYAELGSPWVRRCARMNDSDGDNALHNAVWSGDVSVARFLLFGRHRMDNPDETLLNDRNNASHTPLELLEYIANHPEEAPRAYPARERIEKMREALTDPGHRTRMMDEVHRLLIERFSGEGGEEGGGEGGIE